MSLVCGYKELLGHVPFHLFVLSCPFINPWGSCTSNTAPSSGPCSSRGRETWRRCREGQEEEGRGGASTGETVEARPGQRSEETQEGSQLTTRGRESL